MNRLGDSQPEASKPGANNRATRPPSNAAKGAAACHSKTERIAGSYFTSRHHRHR